MSSGRILLVDDHLDTLRLYETCLCMSGFDVTAASSAVDALRHHAASRFDAITTDLAMPGMDGIELIRRIRESGTQPAIPIVAITGQMVDSETMRGIDCCRLLIKPCDLEEVADLLRSLIHDCRRRRAECCQRLRKIANDGTGGKPSRPRHEDVPGAASV